MHCGRWLSRQQSRAGRGAGVQVGARRVRRCGRRSGLVKPPGKAVSFDPDSCWLCRRPLGDKQRAVLMQAFGRPIGGAHEACAGLVRASSRAAAIGTLYFGQKWLARKAPAVLGLIESYRVLQARLGRLHAGS